AIQVPKWHQTRTSKKSSMPGWQYRISWTCEATGKSQNPIVQDCRLVTAYLRWHISSCNLQAKLS
ncbi:MAG: hypothetical protein VX017_11365, partial [Pseudomonadota bacterium]|nr:hypothetical protein [Pseudomonadota bacterium]